MGLFSPPTPTPDAAERIPPAINLTSWDDMCVERGGITFLILIAIIVFYLGVRYHILISGGEFLKKVTSPLYNHDVQNVSKFRKIMMTLERIFILPYVPHELDSMVMWMFMWFIAITIPMAVTRYYESRWAHDLITLQGPLNLISYYVFGCESLNLTAIPYTEEVDEAPARYPPPPKEDKWERMDYFFSYHLGFGILWLFVGFIQIYKARKGGWALSDKTNWKAHRVFGRVAFVIVICHICMMAIMTRENPVNQHPIILFGYCGMIFRSIRNVYMGVKYARLTASTSPDRNENQSDEDRRQHLLNRRYHEMYMFFVYARTTVGSGTIRFAAWALWLVGQFMKPETRVIIDRGACQTYAEQGIGDATNCWKPVYINLMFTDLIVLWIEVLYLTMQVFMKDLIPRSRKMLKAEKIKKRAALEQQVVIVFPSIHLCLFDPMIDRWVETHRSSLPYFLGLVIENLAEFSALLWYFVVHYSDDIRNFLYDNLQAQERPVDRRKMMRKSILQAKSLQALYFLDDRIHMSKSFKSFYFLDEVEDDENVKED